MRNLKSFLSDIMAEELENVAQAALYCPFGELIYEENAYWMLDTIPRYLFNGKELDEESGMYYYSARYYAPPTFISRDALFEKYPTMSPYAYCNNNPVVFIDPDGRKVVIPGEGEDGEASQEAKEALSQMQAKTNNLTFGLNNGTVEITGGKAKTAEERYMMEVINSQDITVNLIAQNHDDTSDGKINEFGESFGGNSVGDPILTYSTIDINGTTLPCVDVSVPVEAKQYINVISTANSDATLKGATKGSIIWHGIAEAYEGGKYSQTKGSARPASYGGLNGNKHYWVAHSRAEIYFPGSITPDYDIMGNKTGNRLSRYHGN